MRTNNEIYVYIQRFLERKWRLRLTTSPLGLWRVWSNDRTISGRSPIALSVPDRLSQTVRCPRKYLTFCIVHLTDSYSIITCGRWGSPFNADNRCFNLPCFVASVASHRLAYHFHCFASCALIEAVCNRTIPCCSIKENTIVREQYVLDWLCRVLRPVLLRASPLSLALTPSHPRPWPDSDDFHAFPLPPFFIFIYWSSSFICLLIYLHLSLFHCRQMQVIWKLNCNLLLVILMVKKLRRTINW